MVTVNLSGPIIEVEAHGVGTFACVHRFVAQRAAENPNGLAVSSVREDLSYCELDRSANRLANHLRAIRAGLDVDRHPAPATAALAVLKEGGSYLPLDPIHPPVRVEQWREHIPAVVQNLFGSLEGKQEIDVIADIAETLPAILTAEMLGGLFV